ncbi:MAG: hypothetical protein AB4063_02555 [Crocosphaera sp.]
MNSRRKFVRSLKVVAVTLVLLLSLFSSAAMADSSDRRSICIPETTQVAFPYRSSFSRSGELFVDSTKKIPKFQVRSAVISLPDDTHLSLDKLKITYYPDYPLLEDRELEFGCGPIEKVENGTDLITACGGPAYLKRGYNKYYAHGYLSNSKEEPAGGTVTIKLCN